MKSIAAHYLKLDRLFQGLPAVLSVYFGDGLLSRPFTQDPRSQMSGQTND